PHLWPARAWRADRRGAPSHRARARPVGGAALAQHPRRREPRSVSPAHVPAINAFTRVFRATQQTVADRRRFPPRRARPGGGGPERRAREWIGPAPAAQPEHLGTALLQ